MGSVEGGLRSWMATCGFRDQVIDDRWVKLKQSWADYREVPISFACVWRR
jgi:hypothetical protein